MLHVEPIARSNRDEESDASNSVGNARPSEMEKSRGGKWRYMMNG